MLKRIITAVVALLIFIPALVLGEYMRESNNLVGTLITSGVFALICGFSVGEMAVCCGLSKHKLVCVASVFVAVICTMLPPFGVFVTMGLIVALLCASVVAFLFYATVKHKELDIERGLMFFSVCVYIIAGFTALSAMYAYFGLYSIVFVLVTAWGTDTFAYFSGMLFGKKKLCPEISPKKTVAGAIGGTVLGTLAGVLVFWLMENDPAWGLLALPLSIVSQLGDLTASVIKRKFGVKDYGKIFPGHGGVLDRFDSVIATSIVCAVLMFGIQLSYIYLTYGGI